MRTGFTIITIKISPSCWPWRGKPCYDYVSSDVQDPERAKSGMRYPRTTNLALAIGILVGGAFLYVRQSSQSAVQTTDLPAKLSQGAATVQVKLPVALSVEAALGKTYFDAVCASCHGANAAGQEGSAPPLVHQLYKPVHHGDGAFMVAIRNGSAQHHWSFGSMMPIKQPLTNAEISDIILYIRELQRENGVL